MRRQLGAYDVADPAFPELVPIPAASDDATQNAPYRRHADKIQKPNIILRPSASGAPLSSDPTIAAIQQLQQTMQDVARSTRLLSAPWVIEPPDAESFHLPGGVVIPAIDPTLFTTVVQIVVPAGRNGVLNKLANVYVGGGFIDFSGSVVWRIVRNPGDTIVTAERNYEKITASLGSASNPGKIAGIRVFENDVLALQVRNDSVVVAGQLIGGLLGGWFYPRTWDDQFDRQDSNISW